MARAVGFIGDKESLEDFYAKKSSTHQASLRLKFHVFRDIEKNMPWIREKTDFRSYERFWFLIHPNKIAKAAATIKKGPVT